MHRDGNDPNGFVGVGKSEEISIPFLLSLSSDEVYIRARSLLSTIRLVNHGAFCADTCIIWSANLRHIKLFF